MTVKISTLAAVGLACAMATWAGCGDDDDGGQACTGDDCTTGTRDAAATRGDSGSLGSGTRDAGDRSPGSGGSTATPVRDAGGGTSTTAAGGEPAAPAKDASASADAAPPAMTDAGTMEPPPGQPPKDGDQLSLCAKPADCDKDLGCYMVGRGQGFCTAKCDTDEDCEMLEGAEYTCSPEGLCKIDCRSTPPSAAQCPEGLLCMPVSEPGAGRIEQGCKYPASAGTDGRAYSACSAPADCMEGLQCTAAAGASMPGHCSPACMRAAECRRPRTGTIVPSCEAELCVLSCADAPEGCPDGMSCVATRCAYQ